jgi:uncharacterized protein (DUF2345 family)
VNAVSIDLGASNALLLTGTDVTASGADALTFQSGSNMLAFTPTTALIQSVDNAMQISACNDMVIDTQVFTLTTSSNLTVASACNLSLIAPGGALLVTPSNVALISDSNLDILSTADMTIYSGNDLYLTAECNLVITASNLSLPLANFNLDSSGNLNMTAAGTLTVEGGGSEVITKTITSIWDVQHDMNFFTQSASPSGLTTCSTFMYDNDGSPVPLYNADGSPSSVSAVTYEGLSGAFIVRYNTAGIVQWSSTIKTNYWNPEKIMINENDLGDIYVALTLTDAFTGGTQPVVLYDVTGNIVFTYSGTATHLTMLIKYSSIGVPVKYTVYSNVVNGNVYIDGFNNTYVYGNLFSGSSFSVIDQNDQTTSRTLTISNTHLSKNALIKSTNDIFDWACGLSGTLLPYPKSTFVDMNGNVYIVTNSTNGYSIQDSSNSLTSAINSEPESIMLVKFTAQGVYLWHTRITGSFTPNASSYLGGFGNPTLTGDSSGNVYIGCAYYMDSNGTIQLYNSSGSLSLYSLTPASLTPTVLVLNQQPQKVATFVVKYNNTGHVDWSAVVSNTGVGANITQASVFVAASIGGDIIVQSTYNNNDTSALTFCNSDGTTTSFSMPIAQSDTSCIALLDTNGTWTNVNSFLPNILEIAALNVTGTAIYSSIRSTEYVTSTNKYDISYSSEAGALYLRSGSNLVAITPSSISLEVTDAINATACNNLFTVAAASTLFTAADTLYLSASNGISFHSDSNMSLSAFSTDNSLLSLTGDSQVLFWSGTNKFLIEPTFAQFGDSNSFFTLTNAGIIEQSVSTQVTAASNYGLTSSDIAVNSSATLMLTSESNFTASASSIAVATPTGQQLIELDDDTGILVDSAKKILVAANDAVGAQGGMLIDGTTHEVFMASQTETNAVMSSIKCIDSNIIAFATSNQQYFIGSAASGTPILQLTASGTSTAGTQHDIFAANSNVAAISMYQDTDESVLHVLGRVELDGAINTINKDRLDIVDKVVVFASPDSSNIDLIDGMVNDRSGLYIYGKPETPAFSNAPQPGDAYDVTQRYYEKSMIWNMGTQGMDKLGSATGVDYSTSILNESYWQLRGGNLQLTATQSDGSNVRDTSYGFRINSRGELELYKHHWENGQYKARKLKMWGHMVTGQFPA